MEETYYKKNKEKITKKIREYQKKNRNKIIWYQRNYYLYGCKSKWPKGLTYNDAYCVSSITYEQEPKWNLEL